MSVQASSRATILDYVRTAVSGVSNIGNVYREPPKLACDKDVLDRFYDSTTNTVKGGWLQVTGDAQDTPVTVGQGGMNYADIPVSVAYLYAAGGDAGGTTLTDSRAEWEVIVGGIAQKMRQRPATIFAGSGVQGFVQVAPGGYVKVSHLGPERMEGPLGIIVHIGIITVTYREFLTRD